MNTTEALDLLNTYFKSVNSTDTQRVRVFLEYILRADFREVDMRPATPFGDLILSPGASITAVLQRALVDILSDMDLDNLENGRVVNPEFAMEFLKNFGDYTRKSIGSYGIVKLQYPTDVERHLFNHTRFRFNTPVAEHEFFLTLAYGGDLIIRPTDYTGTPTPELNEVRLVQEAANVYTAYVSVHGISHEELHEGDPVYTAPKLPDVIGMYAAADLQPGKPPDDVQSYARLVRRTVYDASFSSRRSAVSFALYKLPDLLAASACITGDPELQRGGPNIAGLQNPALDLYVRSDGTVVKTMLVTIKKDTHAGADVAYGKLPIHNESVLKLLAVEQIDHDKTPVPGLSYMNLMSQPFRASAPYGSGGLCGKESLYLTLDSAQLADEYLEFDSNDLASVVVRVELDAGLENMRHLAQNPDEHPVGVSLDVKPFPTVVITSMHIKYTRAPNISMELEDAEVEIIKTIKSYGYYKRYNSSEIESIMRAAGVSTIVSVRFQCAIEPWAAGTFLKCDTHDTTYTELIAGSTTTPTTTYGPVIDPTPPLPWPVDYDSLTLNPSRVVIGEHNFSFTIDREAITFEELI